MTEGGRHSGVVVVWQGTLPAQVWRQETHRGPLDYPSSQGDPLEVGSGAFGLMIDDIQCTCIRACLQQEKIHAYMSQS